MSRAGVAPGPGWLTIPGLLAVPALAASAATPPVVGWPIAVAVIVLLGVPHGALDVEIARSRFRPSMGRAWFPLFALPYLLLVGAVLLAWHVAPEATLAAFLVASVWHFGSEEAGPNMVAALALGGLPIAAPVLLQPVATAQILSIIAGVPLEACPTWLVGASLMWLVLAGSWAVSQSPRSLLVPGVAVAAFATLPPITAFAGYFVLVHAPRHTDALIHHPTRAPRVVDAASAWRLAAPTLVLTVAIGAMAWPLYGGALQVRLLSLTIQLLAAFTLPHMMFDAWLARQESPTPGRRPSPARPHPVQARS